VTEAIPLARLVGLVEIAKRAKVSHSVVLSWKGYSDFPKPVTKLSSRGVYDWDEVLAWCLRSGRGCPVLPREISETISVTLSLESREKLADIASDYEKSQAEVASALLKAAISKAWNNLGQKPVNFGKKV
jgi:hypothetical protein